jgi:hypothetical protein
MYAFQGTYVYIHPLFEMKLGANSAKTRFNLKPVFNDISPPREIIFWDFPSYIF